MGEVATISGAEIIETVMLRGDLSKLNDEERVRYYMEVCRSVGLNPLTRPFDYIVLDGRLTLYARKDASEQLRKMHEVSTEIVAQGESDGLYSVHIRARTGSGRSDEDIGAVVMLYPDRIKGRNGEWRDHPLKGKPLRGVDRANAMMKAVTKAKRRVTLSICGLGLPDETEIEDAVAAEATLVERPPREVVRPKTQDETRPLPPRVGEVDAVEADTVEPIEDAHTAEREPTEEPDDRDIVLRDLKATLDKTHNATRLAQVWKAFESDSLPMMDEPRRQLAMAHFIAAKKRIAALKAA